MKLSVVTTLYKSERFIDEFYERITKAVQEITSDYELVFVDDGSPDRSNQHILAIREKDTKVKLIELSRNFGHHNLHNAMLAKICLAMLLVVVLQSLKYIAVDGNQAHLINTLVHILCFYSCFLLLKKQKRLFGCIFLFCFFSTYIVTAAMLWQRNVAY